MSRTLADLRNATLEKMGIVAAGETANADDATTVERIITDKHAELEDLSLVYWPTSAIPNAVFGSLTKIMAYECGAEFMLSGNDIAALKTWNDEAMKALHRHIATKVSDAPVRANYF